MVVKGEPVPPPPFFIPVPDTTGVSVPPNLVPDPTGGVEDAQGVAVSVDDPEIVPSTPALTVASPV